MRLSVWLVGWWALFAAASRAEAPASRPLACAVEGSVRGMRASELCRALGRELSRQTALVDDARAVRHGDSIQLIHGDVQWILIWLVNGQVRVWTRVSKIEAADDQLRFLRRAVVALSKLSPGPDKECLRLDPNAGRKMRSPDLTYPWAELRPCRRRQVEVVDPWWLPEHAP